MLCCARLSVVAGGVSLEVAVKAVDVGGGNGTPPSDGRGCG